MKTKKLSKAMLYGMVLALLLAVCVGFGVHTTTSAKAETYTSTDTEITELYAESDFFWFKLSANDYDTTASKGLAGLATRLDTLNTLSKIEMDGQAIGGSFSARDPYINLWGKLKGSFTIKVKATQTVTIKAGCQFPSLNFADGTSDAIYTTTKDVTFAKQGDAWILQMDYTDVDITDTLTVESGIAAAGYTEIKIQVGENVFGNGTWFNDHASELGADVLENIVIRKNGTEKTARALCAENAAKPKEEQYKGGEFPQTNGGVYAPIAVRDNNTQLLLRVLTSYAEPGAFEVVLKSGWVMTLKNKPGYRYVLSRDIVLVQSSNAQYKRASSVTWNVNGVVTSAWVANGDMPVYAGATPTKPSTATTDYTFSGWDKELAAVTGNVTYTAQFGESARKYTVSFVSEDGTTPLSSAQVANGTSVTKPADPEKAATDEYEYTFDGWYTAADVKWDFDTNKMPTEDITLKAKFTQSERKYRVYFTDEEGNPFTDAAYATQELSYQGTAVKPVDPVKESTAAQVFTFMGWYNGETEWDFATQVTEDVTLTAKFSAATRQYDVTVTFDGLEQEKPSVNKKAEYESVIDLNDYNETGYGFTATANGSPIDGKSYTVTGDVTIAITYELGKYVVTFTVEGLSLRPESLPEYVEIAQGQKLTLGDYSVLDYTYKIYYGETEVTVTELDVTGDMTLRVVYTPVPDDDNGGNTGGDEPGDKGGKKGCGGMTAGGTLAGGGVCLAALCAAVLLRKRRSAQDK